MGGSVVDAWGNAFGSPFGMHVRLQVRFGCVLDAFSCPFEVRWGQVCLGVRLGLLCPRSLFASPLYKSPGFRFAGAIP